MNWGMQLCRQTTWTVNLKSLLEEGKDNADKRYFYALQVFNEYDGISDVCENWKVSWFLNSIL